MASRLLSLLPISAADNKSSSKTLTFLPSTLKPHALGNSPSFLFRPIAPSHAIRLRARKPPASAATADAASDAAAAAAASVLPSSTTPAKAGPNVNVMWASRAIKSFAMGELEARKLKYPNNGTETLLMGILVEGTSLAAKFLRANGITLLQVREKTVELLGKSDMYFFSPEHPPLTEQAQRALEWAVKEKLKSGKDGEVTTSHLLLGIWSEENSAGYKILASLGFDNEKAAKLAETANKDFELNYR